MILSHTAEKLQYLLLQVRNSDDPMRAQEVDCFARVLRCDRSRIQVHDLLASVPLDRQLDAVDMVLLGGSGHYSVASEGEWLERALACMRKLHDRSKPTFASCWGFQAMSRALGGRVIHDPDRAELGTNRIQLTAAGRTDPVFGILADLFWAQMGHADRVERLPPGATLLASTDRVANQAFRLEGRPIYCTQFHPELDRASLIQRVETYPEYVEHVAGMTMERFVQSCRDTPETEKLLLQFVKHVFE